MRTTLQFHVLVRPDLRVDCVPVGFWEILIMIGQDTFGACELCLSFMLYPQLWQPN